GCLPVGSEADNAQDMSFFSSFGPCEDGRFKPEIVAPGSAIFGAQDQLLISQASCADPFAPFSSLFDHTVITAPFTCESGTSFSAPAVSGGIQLFWWW